MLCTCLYTRCHLETLVTSLTYVPHLDGITHQQNKHMTIIVFYSSTPCQLTILFYFYIHPLFRRFLTQFFCNVCMCHALSF
jgi:hypothetical protein